MLRRIFISAILLVSAFSFAQTNRTQDSILNLINKSSSDTFKVYQYNVLANHLQNVNPNEAENFALKALDLAKKSNYRRGEAEALYALGEYHNAKGTYGLALEKLLAAAKTFESIKDFRKQASALNAIGNTYLGLHDDELALEFYQKSFDVGEKINSNLTKAYASFGISSLLSRKGNHTEALRQLYFPKVIFENSNKDLQAAFVYVSISEEHLNLGNMDSASIYARKALPIMQRNQNRYGQALAYSALGDIDFKKDKLNAALNNYFMTMQISDEDNAIDNQKDICFKIYELFKKKGNAEQALHYFTRYTKLKDSIYNNEGQNKLLELQTKYDTETKEKQNELLKQEKVIAKKSLQTQRMLSYFIAGVLILVFVFSYFTLKNLKKQKQMNIVLKEQKELVEQSRKEILDSIMYAKRIQATILAHKEFIDDNISQNFVYYRPKDIVSGDFYWATKRNDLFYLAVCDSTGHGVPGAFMSLLSISFLNEAIGEKNITKPNEVFDYVRQKLIENISKEGQKDGFDGILVCYNKKTSQITYAAANNKPIIVKGSSKEIIQLPSDRMPVGFGERKDGFALHELNVEKEDTLYLFTDGYADQFGGDKGKKLMYKNLYEFLVNISNQPFESQTESLNTNFESWKGNLEQVDDVCVIGLKFAS